jgi:hypothetical protein
MYDFLYDQQDLFDHYDEAFENKNKSFGALLNVRKPELPFANALENFDDIMAEFFEEKDMLSLANLRWYICHATLDKNDDENFNGFGMGNNMTSFTCTGANNILNEDIFSIFSTTCTENFTARIIDIEESNGKNSNHLLSLLNSIVLTFTYFCKISLQYMIKYQHNDHLFLDCFIKRYKSYVESAIYINEQMENLNVIVNYAYETMYKDYPKNPKFSIYRLMVK